MNPPRPRVVPMDEHVALLLRVSWLEKQLDELKKENENQEGRIDRLTLAVVGAALTLTVFALGIAATLLTAGVG